MPVRFKTSSSLILHERIPTTTTRNATMSMMSIVNIQKSLKSMIMMARLVRPIAMVEVELATSTTKQMTVTETYSNKSVSNQVLRKLVKHHNLVNVNSIELLYIQRAPFGVFFFRFSY